MEKSEMVYHVSKQLRTASLQQRVSIIANCDSDFVSDMASVVLGKDYDPPYGYKASKYLNETLAMKMVISDKLSHILIGDCKEELQNACTALRQLNLERTCFGKNDPDEIERFRKRKNNLLTWIDMMLEGRE